MLTNKTLPHRGWKIAALICGLLGCLCFGAGDWLMLYGDPTYSGSLSWLTEGAAGIASWRNGLAMGLAFPGVLLYGIALFSLESYIAPPRGKRVYRYLTAFGLTPWLCLHLFYIMILFTFGWMRQNGMSNASAVCEAMFNHLQWLPLASEVLMIPPFLYWFYLQITGKTVFPRAMAFTNVLVIYGVLYAVKSLLPVSAFRLGFTNGLMSESMAVWFLLLLLTGVSALNRRKSKRIDEEETT